MTTPAPKPKTKPKPRPAPPAKPISFTGQVPRPPLRQSMREWGQRQRARGQKAKTTLGNARRKAKRITRGQAKRSPGPNQRPASTRPGGNGRRRAPSRRMRKRGPLFAVVSMGIATLALTAVVLEITSLAVATEMAFVADGLGGLVVLWVGEPSNKGPVRQRSRPGSKPANTGGCSPACQHGKPEKRDKCTCACGGAQHGIKRGGGSKPPNTSTPQPRKRKPAAPKAPQSGPSTGKPPARRAPRAKPAPTP